VFADAFLASVAPPPQVVPLLGQALASNAMYAFLFVSHLGMVIQAFLIYRYSDFPGRAILVALIRSYAELWKDPITRQSMVDSTDSLARLIRSVVTFYR
jgi:hypothetical protein